MGLSKAFGSKQPARPHLVRGQGGVPGEINELRDQIDDAFLAMEKGGMIVKYFLSVPTDAADADGIKTAFASAAAPATLTGADFDGILAPGTGAAIMLPPKRITLTVAGTGTPANWTGGDVIFTGTDADGEELTETVVSAAGAGTTTTVGYFATLTQVDIVDAQAGALASLSLGVAADTASIASITSSDTAQVIDANTEFNRARIGNRLMTLARRISFVLSNHADWNATTITVTGFDALGRKITDTIAVPDGGNTTVTTAKFFAQITRIDVPAQAGAGGTCSVGFLNAEIGLDVDPLSSVVAVSVIREGNDPGTGVWAVPTAGALAIASASNSAPYGKYTPNVAPDGVRSYVLAYLPNPA